MSEAPSMPLFCGDYLADTMHLTLEQHGAYLKLLMVTWRARCVPFADDDATLSRILGVSPSRWRKSLRPALLPFFDLSDGKWRQKRLENEWQVTAEKIVRSRENGRKGGRPKSLKNNEPAKATGSMQDSPEGNPEQKPDESTHPHSQDTPPYSPPTGDRPKRNRRKPETALPDGFPDAEAKAEAEKIFAEFGRTDLRVATVAGNFRDHATANDRRQRDWSGAWRMWARNQASKFGELEPVAARAEPKDRDWRALCRLAKERPEAWDRDRLGPRPGEPGCRAPVEVQCEFGFADPEAPDRGEEIGPDPSKNNESAADPKPKEINPSPGQKSALSPEAQRIQAIVKPAMTAFQDALDQSRAPEDAEMALADLRASEAWNHIIGKASAEKKAADRAEELRRKAA